MKNMKKLPILIVFLVATAAFIVACKDLSAFAAANNAPNDATHSVKVETNAVPAPTPVKKEKTQQEKDLAAGVKADDYDEHSGSDKSSGNLCDVEAYVVDKDPAGLNIRSEPGKGNVIGKIPFDEDGTIVHIISTDFNGWVQIDHASTVESKIVFDKKGWVSANLLATSTAGYRTQGVELSESAAGSKVLTFIPPETEVRLYSCDGKRVRVKYKKFTGWLGEDLACPNPVTNCS
jgi:SH3-like domain-containing protein